MKNTMQPGDIILFEKVSNDDILGDIIEILTGSKAVHAGMIYTDNTILELCGNGIKKTAFDPNGFHINEKDKCVELDGVNAHLLRLNKDIDREPLLRSAECYLNQDIEFGYVEIVYLARLLLYKHVVPTEELIQVIKYIFHKAISALQALHNQGKTDNPAIKRMLCSGLVYQIYEDSGPDYQIKFRGELLSPPPKETVRLIDHFEKSKDSSMSRAYAYNDPPLNQADFNKLLENLHSALTSKNVITPEMMVQNNQYEIILAKGQSISDILEGLIKELEEGAEVDIYSPALYVTPADLLSHSENLVEYNPLV